MTDYADRIEKLLAKAESSTHEEEAKTFRDKAGELMLKWGIDDAMLADKKRQQKKAGEKIVRLDIELGGEYHRGLWYVYNGIAEGLGNMRTMIMRGRGNQTWFVVVGYESDVKRVELLGRSLQIQALSAMKEWWKNGAVSGRGRLDRPMAFVAKRQFVISFGHGVGTVLKEQRNAALAEAEAGTELVFVGRDKRVGEWVAENLEIKETKGGIRGNYNAQQHGFRAGERAGQGVATKDEVGA